MPKTNNQSESTTLTNEQELYKQLSFSEEQIREDQNQTTNNKIDVNYRLLVAHSISERATDNSVFSNKIKKPIENLDEILDNDPSDQLLCLNNGKLYFIENFDQITRKGTAYVIAEDVEFKDNELTQGSKEKNSYQNLVVPAKMTKNDSKDTHTLFVNSRVVYDIIQKNERYEKAKEAEKAARTITEPDETYIGDSLKIGIPKRTSSDLIVNVQLMLHKGNLYQLDTENRKSKLIADNVEHLKGTFYKRNSQGMRVTLFRSSNVENAYSNNFFERNFTKDRDEKKRDKTATMCVDGETLEKINQRLKGFKIMEEKQQIKSRSGRMVNAKAFSSLPIPKNPTPHLAQDLFYYKEGEMKDFLYKLKIETIDDRKAKVVNAYLIAGENLYNWPDATHIALMDPKTTVKIDLFSKFELSNGMIWLPKGELEKKIAYHEEARKHFPTDPDYDNVYNLKKHENRNKDTKILLLKDNDLYLVDPKQKSAMQVAKNVQIYNGKLKSGDKVIASNVPNNSKWSISSDVAAKFVEIAKINQANNIVQGRSTIEDLTNRAKALTEALSITKSELNIHAATKSAEMTKTKSVENISQGGSSLEDATTHAQALIKHGNFTQSATNLTALNRRRMKRPAPQPQQKINDPSR
ncbi:hypothetical protein ACTPGT_001467 [Enterococcus hirae]